MKKTSSSKKFAALAPPYNKATAADRIAGAKGATPKMKKGGETNKSSQEDWRKQQDKDLTGYLEGTRNRPAPKKVDTFSKSNPGTASSSTRVAKNFKVATPKMKMGGSCSTPKRLKK